LGSAEKVTELNELLKILDEPLPPLNLPRSTFAS